MRSYKAIRSFRGQVGDHEKRYPDVLGDFN